MSQAGTIDVENANPQIPTQFDTDSGDAIPIDNVLEIIGGAGIETSGSGNTVTISLTGGGAGIDTLITDIPGPTVPDGLGNVTITGTSIFSDGTVANTTSLNVQATENAFIYGQGPNTNVAELGPLTNGQIIIGSTGLAPVAANLTSTDGSVSITNGAGSIDLAVAASDDAILTLTGDSGGPQSPTAGNINIFGLGETETSGASSTISILSPRVSEFIVDPTLDNGTHQTIASALTDASSGDNIFVRPGTYTEDLTLKAGVNIHAFTGDAFTPLVTIIGTCTATFAGTCVISGIRLQTNTDFALVVSGASATRVRLENCYINATDNTAISYTSSSSSSLVSLKNCTGDITTTGITLFADSGSGVLAIRDCSFGNSGFSTTSSTSSAGSLSIFRSFILLPIETLGTSVVALLHNSFNTTAIATTPITLNATSVNNGVFLNHLSSGSAAAFAQGAGNTVKLTGNVIMTSNANQFSIAGTATERGNFFGESRFGVGLGAEPTTNNVLNILKNQNAVTQALITNSTDGTAAQAAVRCTSTSSNRNAAMIAGSPSHTTARLANRADFSSGTDSDGVNLTSQNTSGNIRNYIGSTIIAEGTSAGEWTYPLQPAFLALNSATDNNVTGDGTVVSPVEFNTEIFDQNGDYNNTTHTFTAPVAGRYRLTTNVYVIGLSSANTILNLQIVTSKRNFGGGGIPHSVAPATHPLSLTALCDMDAGDTAFVTVSASGSTLTADIFGQATNPTTCFFGELVC